MYQSIPKLPIPPPLRAIPGHLTRVKLRTVAVGHLTFVKTRSASYGHLTQNEARRRAPGGAFDFCVKTSVSGRKQKDFAIL